MSDPPFSGYTSDYNYNLHLLRLSLRITTRRHLTGREALSDTERECLALSARHGRSSIPHTHNNHPSSFHCQLISDSSLVELFWQHNTNYPVGARLKQRWLKVNIHISTTVMQPSTYIENVTGAQAVRGPAMCQGPSQWEGPCHGWPSYLQRSTTSASISRHAEIIVSQAAFPL